MAVPGGPPSGSPRCWWPVPGAELRARGGTQHERGAGLGARAGPGGKRIPRGKRRKFPRVQLRHRSRWDGEDPWDMGKTGWGAWSSQFSKKPQGNGCKTNTGGAAVGGSVKNAFCPFFFSLPQLCLKRASDHALQKARAAPATKKCEWSISATAASWGPPPATGPVPLPPAFSSPACSSAGTPQQPPGLSPVLLPPSELQQSRHRGAPSSPPSRAWRPSGQSWSPKPEPKKSLGERGSSQPFTSGVGFFFLSFSSPDSL